MEICVEEQVMLKEEKIKMRINIFRKMYFAFACIYIFAILYSLSGLSKRYGRNDVLGQMLPMLVFILIYIGLSHKRRWLIPLVLISSTFALIRTSIMALQPPISTPYLIPIARVAGIAFISFYGYQIYFFSKSEVRSYFKEGGFFLF